MLNRVLKSILMLCAFAVFSFMAGGLFSQNREADQPVQRGSIPEELIRPRREESPHYPADTVIGPLGQGTSPREAYELARRAAIALLAGNADAPALSSMNRTYLRDCIGQIQLIDPRYYRVGGGREEPDGSASFMVRFVGREYAITGEMFIQLHERRPAAPASAPAPATAADENEEDAAAEEPAGPQTAEEASVPPPPEQIVQAPLAPVARSWSFDDVILEDPRSLGEENREIRQRFDFPPYERFF